MSQWKGPRRAALYVRVSSFSPESDAVRVHLAQCAEVAMGAGYLPTHRFIGGGASGLFAQDRGVDVLFAEEPTRTISTPSASDVRSLRSRGPVRGGRHGF